MRAAARGLGALGCLVAAAACAAPEKRGWEPTPERELVSSAPRTIDLAATLPSELPPAVDSLRPPGARDYPPPAGGREVANAAGPADPRAPEPITLPPELWLPAVPPSFAAAVRSGELVDELVIEGVDERDLDGDGSRELVVLARPAALFEAERAERFALLLGLTRKGPLVQLAAAHLLTPERHAAGTGPARWCHAEWRLAGALRRGAASVPLVYEERGVGCARIGPGGGVERSLWLVELGRPGAVAQRALLGRARLGEPGAVELVDGIGWAADVEGDGNEELLVRGVTIGARRCGAGLDPPFWIEELATRVFVPGAAAYALRDGARAPLPDGLLPPQLLRSHPASCGNLPALGGGDAP